MTAKPQTNSVAKMLETLGSIFASRNKEYGDDYHHFGKTMLGFFPRGVTLKTEKDFGRFALFTFAAAKLSRYAKNFAKGGHPDSLDDAAVYSQMLQELDRSTE
jgi:hypothetical protein